MAVMLSQKHFFSTVFGPAWADEWIDPLLNAGVKFEVPFIEIKATYKGKTESVTLSVTTSVLVKSGTAPAVLEKAKHTIRAFVEHLNYDVVQCKTPPVAAPTPGGATAEVTSHATQFVNVTATAGGTPQMTVWGSGGGGGNINSATVTGTMAYAGPPQQIPKNFAEIVADLAAQVPHLPETLLQQVVPLLPAEQAAKLITKNKAAAKQKILHPSGPAVGALPLPQVIPLRDAKVVGQRVKGTDSDSVYRAIAISDGVKLAARITGSTISIRAEFGTQPTDQELMALKSIGMSAKGNNKHMSMHISAGDVSPGRVLGAFLMDLGLEFQQQIKTLKELQS